MMISSCCIKETYIWKNSYNDEDTEKTRWIIDKNIPLFKGEDWQYIDKLIYVGE